MRHDSLRDRTAGYLKDAGCKDIRVEPELLPCPVDPGCSSPGLTPSLELNQMCQHEECGPGLKDPFVI